MIYSRHGAPARFEVEAKSGHRIGTGLPVIAEQVYGIEYGENRDRNMKSLRSVLPTIKLWPFDQAAAFEYGRLAAELRRIGRRMQVIDVMIAAIALILQP